MKKYFNAQVLYGLTSQHCALYLFTQTQTHIHMYIYICVCIYIYIHTHTYIYICIFFPLVTKLPTFIKDTTDVIRLCKDFKFTDDYQYRYLFTMDICSLYTNIPTAEGLAALRYYLKYYPDDYRPSTPTLLKLTELVLNLSSFEFDGK